jgi:type IV pilus assembly protein PilY1
VLDALAGLPSDGGGTVLARGVTGILAPGPLHGAPLLLPGARTRTARDPAGRIRVARETAIVHVGTDVEPVAGAGSSAAWLAGRLSWREVANWRQLHRAATAGGQP